MKKLPRKPCVACFRSTRRRMGTVDHRGRAREFPLCKRCRMRFLYVAPAREHCPAPGCSVLHPAPARA